MYGDSCNFCEIEHGFDSELGDTIYVFLDSPCHYIHTTCPSCGCTTQIYLSPEDVIDIGEQSELPLKLYPNTPKFILDGYENAQNFREVEDAVTAELEAMYHENDQ
jgi:hypothetical protein